jgi:hypothetical protein
MATIRDEEATQGRSLRPPGKGHHMRGNGALFADPAQPSCDKRGVYKSVGIVNEAAKNLAIPRHGHVEVHPNPGLFGYFELPPAPLKVEYLAITFCQHTRRL